MAGAKLLVAVVDDEESVRRAFERLIRSAGMDAELFASGEELLRALPSEKPDCVVLDLHMPGMNGLEVHARLSELHPFLPVVVITGQDTLEAEMRVMGAGAAAYLLKPVEQQTLLEAIARAAGTDRSRGMTR